MKNKFHFIILFIFVSISIGACKEDDVSFIQYGENIPLNEVMKFQFSESNGETTLESVHSTNYQISGYNIYRMSGVEGNAMFFDGLSNEINGTIQANQFPNERMVISLFAAPKSYPVGTASMLAFTQQGSNTGAMIGLNRFGQLVVQYFIDGTLAQQVSSAILPRYEWSHVVVEISPVDQIINAFIDGQNVLAANIPSGTISLPSGNIPVTLGKNTMGESLGIFDVDFYSGGLDEVVVYEGKATQEELAFLASEYTNPGLAQYDFQFDYSTDSNRPMYHAVPESGWANEAYGLIGLDGMYHMFYQKNEVFLGISQQNWGHFTSSDLVNWQEQNAVLWPSEGWDQVGIWSGCTIIADGVPTAIYTGVDGARAGMGIATSSDNFMTLDKHPQNPVIPQAPNDVNLDFRDPFVWEENGMYHMVIGSGISGIGGNVVYYSSPNMTDWTYGGIAFQGQIGEGEGQFWEMPVVYSFDNGKEMLLIQKTPDATPARSVYWIGQFENGVFTPEFSEAKPLEIVNGFLSPTVHQDLNGNITAIGIIPDEVAAEFQQQQGWANLFSVPQVWSLNSNNEIEISAHPNLLNLRGNFIEFNNVNITSGESNFLNNYQGKQFELQATINTGTAQQVGFVFGKSATSGEEYKIYYDLNTQEWVVDASNSSTSNLVRRDIRTGEYAIEQGDSFDVRIFVDGSVVEVFVDGKAHFTGRYFPVAEDAVGVDLMANGGSATADITIFEINP